MQGVFWKMGGIYMGKKFLRVLFFVFLLVFSVFLKTFADDWTLKINNKPTQIRIMEINGKMWVSLEDFIKILGFKLTVNKDKKTVQLKVPETISFPSHGTYVKTEELKNRYFFKIAYVEGDFTIDVYINKKKIGTYNGIADVDITKHLKKGENKIKIEYHFSGGHSGFYFALQELVEGKGRKTLEAADIMYVEKVARPKKGEKSFILEAK